MNETKKLIIMWKDCSSCEGKGERTQTLPEGGSTTYKCIICLGMKGWEMTEDQFNKNYYEKK